MLGAMMPGANSAPETSTCSAVIATSAGPSGTGFESTNPGACIRARPGGANGGRHFGSCGRRGARAPGLVDSKPVPLGPALVAMTALQVLVSGALFAPGIMAPSIGIDPATLGLYTTAACAVGVVTAFVGGMLASRFG